MHSLRDALAGITQADPSCPESCKDTPEACSGRFWKGRYATVKIAREHKELYATQLQDFDDITLGSLAFQAVVNSGKLPQYYRPHFDKDLLAKVGKFLRTALGTKT